MNILGYCVDMFVVSSQLGRAQSFFIVYFFGLKWKFSVSFRVDSQRQQWGWILCVEVLVSSVGSSVGGGGWYLFGIVFFISNFEVLSVLGIRGIRRNLGFQALVKGLFCKQFYLFCSFFDVWVWMFFGREQGGLRDLWVSV